MSRLGKKPVEIPSGVKVSVSGGDILVEGPKGRLTWTLPKPISVAVDDSGKVAVVSREGDTREAKSFHGLSRALLQNMVIGVTKGYEKKLEVVGVGYIAAISGRTLQLRVGLANELQVPIPDGLTVTCPDQQHVLIQGIDKQLVTCFAASVRALRKPEPYKGKGIRYDGEAVRRKQGKVMAK
ncbi:MAG: 50S ribosomal protein L6 [Planctomycetia bacterium]|nr:50S ribosomal protein L6 [Planctomycetia bacterium]